MRILFLIIIFCFSQLRVYCSDWVYYFKNNEDYLNSNSIVIMNALNLSDIQKQDLFLYDKSLKKVLTRKQKSKFSMIKRLERQGKKRPLDYEKIYIKNPKLRKFGNPEIDKNGIEY